MEPIIYTLPNGFRFVHQRNNSPVAHCGLTVNAGTRDETPAENGLAHLTEHMLFKGTTKRAAYHINNRLENVGGELNAFTTKEETVVHATVLKSDIEKAVELIADMAFHSTFPEKELVKEKEVILDEINSYKDNPTEQIFDDFEKFLFSESPIGQPTLGTPESLENIGQRQLVAFTQKYYRCPQMVFSSVGKITPKRIETFIEKHFGGFNHSNADDYTRVQPPIYKPFQKEEEKNTFQANCIIGNRAYPLSDARRIGLAVLINYLGGPASNSRLNTLLREKNGLVYTIDATYTPYSDTGAMTIYFGCDKENVSRCVALVQKELRTVSQQSFSAVQLHRIKKQLLGQLAIASENGESQMLSQGKSVMAFNKVETLEQMRAKIDAITASDLLAIANEIFAPDCLSMLIYK